MPSFLLDKVASANILESDAVQIKLYFFNSAFYCNFNSVFKFISLFFQHHVK